MRHPEPEFIAFMTSVRRREGAMAVFHLLLVAFVLGMTLSGESLFRAIVGAFFGVACGMHFASYLRARTLTAKARRRSC